MMNKNVILIGAGGHSKVIADIIIKSGDKILGFIDDTKAENEIPFGYPKLGTFKNINEILSVYPEAVYILAIGDNKFRKTISEKFALKYYTAIHPNSIIGDNVVIGKGTVIMANSVINSYTKIGNHCIINTGSIVEHDNFLSDFVHISPNATLGGTVNVGELTHIGIGSIVKNNTKLGPNIVIGAGAVVINDIKEKGIYIGIPVRRIKNE